MSQLIVQFAVIIKDGDNFTDSGLRIWDRKSLNVVTQTILVHKLYGNMSLNRFHVVIRKVRKDLVTSLGLHWAEFRRCVPLFHGKTVRYGTLVGIINLLQFAEAHGRLVETDALGLYTGGPADSRLVDVCTIREMPADIGFSSDIIGVADDFERSIGDCRIFPVDGGAD